LFMQYTSFQFWKTPFNELSIPECAVSYKRHIKHFKS